MKVMAKQEKLTDIYGWKLRSSVFANTEILVSSVISGIIIVVVYLTSVKIKVNYELIIIATG